MEKIFTYTVRIKNEKFITPNPVLAMLRNNIKIVPHKIVLTKTK